MAENCTLLIFYGVICLVSALQLPVVHFVLDCCDDNGSQWVTRWGFVLVMLCAQSHSVWRETRQDELLLLSPPRHPYRPHLVINWQSPPAVTQSTSLPRIKTLSDSFSSINWLTNSLVFLSGRTVSHFYKPPKQHRRLLNTNFMLFPCPRLIYSLLFFVVFPWGLLMASKNWESEWGVFITGSWRSCLLPGASPHIVQVIICFISGSW